MESGKAQVLGAIIQLDRPFRNPQICDMTGLDRQLVRYHLNKFVDAGYLEKVGKYYSIHDKGALIESFINIGDASIREMRAAGFFSPDTARGLNSLNKAIIYARVLKLLESHEMQAHLNKRIDDTINELKALKRALNNSQPTAKSAAKYFSQDTTLYERLVEYHGYVPAHSKKDWLDSIEVASEELL